VSFPLGRLAFGYSAPPQEQTPLVLQVFNPTFWIMVEMWTGVWAANLAPCAPLLRSLHPFKTISSLYSKATSAFSSRFALTEKQRQASHDSGKPLTDGLGNDRVSHTRKISDVPPSLREFHWNATGHLSMDTRHSSDDTN
jgi:hypothetical protein